jgi:hypothetical protein
VSVVRKNVLFVFGNVPNAHRDPAPFIVAVPKVHEAEMVAHRDAVPCCAVIHTMNEVELAVPEGVFVAPLFRPSLLNAFPAFVPMCVVDLGVQ